MCEINQEHVAVIVAVHHGRDGVNMTDHLVLLYLVQQTK